MDMPKRKSLTRVTKLALLVLLTLLAIAPTAFAQDAQLVIDSTAMGTSTQLGRNTSVKLLIYSFSTPEDRQTLMKAFQQGQNQGLVDALQKMKSVGRIQIPGTLGYDVAYIRETQTPTGRQIRFVTNRKISFKEAYRNTQSQAYNLTAGQIDINDKDKSKSAGVLYPAAQLTINKNGELQIELRKNPWRLTNIIVRGKGAEQ
jgi:hypothetical protein